MASPPPPPPVLVVSSSSSASTLSSSFLQNITSIALGYAIGVLALLSSLLLASYICFRSRNPNPNPNASSAPLPRLIFSAADDGDDDEGDRLVAGWRAVGLDPAAIGSYPKFPYSSAKGGENVCSICLCEYREEEMLRTMPDCRHYFHLTCIDPWLRLNSSCPVCRNSPVPTPLSTPLSELVPLSHYSEDQRRR